MTLLPAPRVLGLAFAAIAASATASADVLLIPDSSNDRVWAFSPVDGSVVDPEFIPDDGMLVQPICAVGSGTGTILISDENADAIFEYDLAGSFVRVVADADDGLDALFGLHVEDDVIYVVSRSQGTIYSMTLDGTDVTPWAEDLGTPRDLLFRDADVLVTESSNEDIVSLALDGSFNGIWHDSDGMTGIDFPQQIQPLPAAEVLVAGFSAPFGLYVYDEDGLEAEAYTNLITSPRGVYPLDNGMFLYAGGTRVMLYNPITRMEMDVINESGTSFRFIERLVVVGDLTNDGRVDGADLGVLLAAWGPCDPAGAPCPADLDGNGMVDGGDLGILLSAWSG